VLTPRNVILASIAVLAISLVWGVISLMGEPDSGGRGRDSYGVRRDGQRGLYETLSELGLPVRRSVEPPGRGLPTASTVVLWGPQAMLVAFEPRYLQRLRDWVDEGGRVVVAPAAASEFMIMDEELENFDTTIWEALGLDGVSIDELDRGDLPLPAEAAAQAPKSGTAATLDDVMGEFAAEDRPRAVLDVTATGSLQSLAADVRQITVPGDRLQVVASRKRRPAGELTFRDVVGARRALAAAYTIGKGEIIVVGDPMLFNNFALAQTDNSVLAAHLLLDGDREAVLDEFYHGLSVRGNPFWLLTKPGYALLVAAILLMVGIVTWREAILIGPPLTNPDASRRTMAEYVDAMSRFFNRGRKTRAFLLEAVRDGALRHVAAEHGLANAKLEVESIAAAVGRRNPERAKRLREATAQVDAVLAKGHKGPESETVQAIAALSEVV
jgi:hypothetical protein